MGGTPALELAALGEPRGSLSLASLSVNANPIRTGSSTVDVHGAGAAPHPGAARTRRHGGAVSPLSQQRNAAGRRRRYPWRRPAQNS